MKNINARWPVDIAQDLAAAMTAELTNNINFAILMEVFMTDYKAIMDHPDKFATPALNTALDSIRNVYSCNDFISEFNHFKSVLTVDVLDDIDVFTLRVLGYDI